MVTQTEKPYVLVVDDHAANRMAFEVVLESDYQVVLADSGRRALELVHEHDFALVLLDIRMPIMDGLETAVRLRQTPAGRHLPIIFTSAEENSASDTTRRLIAATDFLLTPAHPDLLKFKVDTVSQAYLRNKALQQQVRQMSDAIDALKADMAASAQDTRLRDRLRQLEKLNAELRRQIMPFGVAN